MTRNLQYVPYGYEPPIETHKGTMVYYDTFEQITARELELFAETGLHYLLQSWCCIRYMKKPSEECGSSRYVRITSGWTSWESGSGSRL